MRVSIVYLLFLSVALAGLIVGPHIPRQDVDSLVNANEKRNAFKLKFPKFGSSVTSGFLKGKKGWGLGRKITAKGKTGVGKVSNVIGKVKDRVKAATGKALSAGKVSAIEKANLPDVKNKGKAKAYSVVDKSRAKATNAADNSKAKASISIGTAEANPTKTFATGKDGSTTYGKSVAGATEGSAREPAPAQASKSAVAQGVYNPDMEIEPAAATFGGSEFETKKWILSSLKKVAKQAVSYVAKALSGEILSSADATGETADMTNEDGSPQEERFPGPAVEDAKKELESPETDAANQVSEASDAAIEKIGTFVSQEHKVYKPEGYLNDTSATQAPSKPANIPI